MNPTTDPGVRAAQSGLAPDVLDPPTRGGEEPTTSGGETDAASPIALDQEDDYAEQPAPEPQAPQTGHQALARALRAVEQGLDAEFVAVVDGLEELREREEDMQSKLEELYLQLGTIQDELASNAKSMREAMHKRSGLSDRRWEQQAAAMQRTLLADAARLRQRAEAWKAYQHQAEDRLQAFKDNPQLAEELSAFRRQEERLDTLELLPDGYREVVKQHHEDMKARLAPYLEEPEHVELEQLRLGIAIGIEADVAGDRGTSGRVRAVLPVEFKTHTRARKGEGDLPARFAFRVLASLSRFVVHIGARTETRAVDLDGLLGLEVPFEDLDVPVQRSDLARVLREAFDDARDTQLAKVSVDTDLVFVSMRGLDRLWASVAPEPETPTRGGKRKK